MTALLVIAITLFALSALVNLWLIAECHRVADQRDRAQDEAESYYAELIAMRAAKRNPDLVSE